MEYNFNEVIDRRNSDAIKLEALKPRWGREDLIPMWIADMDFRTPSYIIDAIRKRCDNGILGYTSVPENWSGSIINWLDMRYGWRVSAEMLTFSPGIVQGLAFALQALTKEEDRVMVLPPVYHPFFLITQKNNRRVVFSPLELKDGKVEIDFNKFRKDIKGCKVFILCNPHNPGGRVWREEELTKMADICHENGTLVFSDEIHADLTFPERKHIPFATVSEKAGMNSVTFMSPSKAFNMPGLASSYVVIENETIRKQFKKYMEASELDMGHVFAFIGAIAAYSNGTEWLEQMLEYVTGNIDYLIKYCSEKMPKIKPIRPEASFLVFLDCRELGLDQQSLVNFFVDGAHLALNDGSIFGQEGTGFMRMNVACPRSVLEKALLQLEGAYFKMISDE
ncbi:MAG: PatB family C-S lyase [Rikenellaceae bacterium]|nr:PatB family C-S lyase [Rikenellaceae bacterium]